MIWEIYFEIKIKKKEIVIFEGVGKLIFWNRLEK